MPYTGEETNKKLGALIIVTKELVESREEEKKDASFFDVPSPSGEPGDAVDSEGNKLVLSKAGNLMQAGADGKATVMSPVGATSKIPNIPSMALPRMGDAGRAGQAEDDAEGTTEPDEKKRNSLLSKMTGFLADQAKEKGKIAKLGLKAFFGTLVFGGFLIALGKFLQSDTFKKVTEFIDKTLIPKLKTFYDAFFGPEGGLFKGIMTLFGDESGIGAIVAGIAVVTALMGVAALKALFSPLTLGLGLLFKGIRGLGRMIPKVPGGPGAGPAGAGPAGGGPAGSKPGRTRRPRGRFGALLNIGKILASKAKKLVTSGGAKTVAKVAGTAAVAGAALATTRAPKPPAAIKPPAPPAAIKPPAPPAAIKPPAASGGGVTDKLKHLSKFPLLKKAATKIPILGPLLSGAFAVQLLMSDAPKEEKIKGIGGLLGGALGAVGLAKIGGLIGLAFGGIGAPIGAAIGGLAGWFGGEWAGKKLAGFLMGDMVEDEKPKVPAGSSEGKKFNTEPARKQVAAAKAKKDETSMYLEFMRSQQVVTGETADGIELKGFTGPDAAENQAQFEAALKADKQAGIQEKKAKSQFSYVVSKGKIKNISGLTGDKFDQEELGAKLRFLVGEGVMDDKYVAEQFNGGKTSFAFIAEVNKTYDDLLTQKSKVTPPPKKANTASGAGDVGTGIPMSMPGDAAPTPAAALVDSKGKKLSKGMQKQFAGLPKSMRTQEFANFIPTPIVDKYSLNRKSLKTAKREYETAIKRGDVVDPRSKEQLAALKEGQQLARSNMPGGGTPKKANIAQNKVGPQTADLKAAIAKKLAMAGNTSTAAAATQQGGGNTQINNVSKKEGDVTHMPKSDIRNNKFAALNRSAYTAGAI